MKYGEYKLIVTKYVQNLAQRHTHAGVLAISQLHRMVSQFVLDYVFSSIWSTRVCGF